VTSSDCLGHMGLLPFALLQILFPQPHEYQCKSHTISLWHQSVYFSKLEHGPASTAIHLLCCDIDIRCYMVRRFPGNVATFFLTPVCHLGGVSTAIPSPETVRVLILYIHACETINIWMASAREYLPSRAEPIVEAIWGGCPNHLR
jgi:hypothetical protein